MDFQDNKILVVLKIHTPEFYILRAAANHRLGLDTKVPKILLRQLLDNSIGYLSHGEATVH